MKSVTISGILLIVMAAYLIIPALPVIDYLVNKDYIAKNLCVNKDNPKSCCKGKCHMVKQLQKTNQNPEKDPKNTGNRIQFNELDQYILGIPAYHYLAINYIKHLIFNKSELILLLNSVKLLFIFTPPLFSKVW